MKQSKQQRIGQSGEKLLPTLLPDGWIVQRLDPDYGEDFRVRLVQGEDVLAPTIIVQVKTVEKVKLRGGEVKLQLEQKDLAFWADPQYRDTLFVVVIDLSTKKAYWLFMRRYLMEVAKGWKGKKKPTVYVPLANDLSDTAAFTSAVTDAHAYTARATSVPAKDQIEEHFAEMRRLDHRFDFKYLQEHGKGMCFLQAKEKVQLQIQIKTKRKREAQSKAVRLFKRGELVAFKPGEFVVEGSPLFDRLSQEGCSVQMSLNTPLSLSIALYCDDERLSELAHLPGKMTGGIENMIFTTKAHTMPVRFTVTCDPRTLKGGFNVNFDLSDWRSKRISEAKLFKQLVPFMSDMAMATHAKLTYHQDGESFNAGQISGWNLKPEVHDSFLTLRKLLTVATLHGIDPRVPVDQEWDSEGLEILHTLAERQCYTCRANQKTRLNGMMRRTLQNVEELYSHFGSSGNDFLMVTSEEFDVFGEKVEVTELAVRFEKVTVEGIDEIRRLAEMDDGSDEIEVRLMPLPGTMVTFMNAADCPGWPPAQEGTPAFPVLPSIPSPG